MLKAFWLSEKYKLTLQSITFTCSEAATININNPISKNAGKLKTPLYNWREADTVQLLWKV